MAIADTKKIDYLWKKIGYGVAKTDTNDLKKAPNEAIASPLLLRGDKTWNQASDIATVLPASTTGVVTVYPTSSPQECTADNTSTLYRTWKTGLTDWIPPEFGSTYQVKVYIHTSSDASNAAGSGTQVFATGSGNNDEWFFDYQAGLLHFIGTNLPTGVDFAGKSVYIAGGRYTGTQGLQNLTSTSTAGGSNTVVSTFEYNKLSTTEVVINEFDIDEYKGAVYHIAIQDVNNNLIGQVNVKVIHDNSTVLHSVYDLNEDSTNLISWDSDIINGKVRLLGASLSSNHINLQIYRVALGDHLDDASSTNTKVTVTSTEIGSTAVTVDSFTKTDFYSAKYYALVKDESNGYYEITEIIVTHNGSTPYVSSSVLRSSTSAGSTAQWNARISGSNVILEVSSNNSRTLTTIVYRVGLGPDTKFGVYDNVYYGKIADIDSSAKTIDSFDVFAKRTARYFVSINNGTDYQTSEISVVSNGSNAYFTETNNYTGSSPIITFSTDVSNGQVRLRGQGTGFNNVVYFARVDFDVPTIYRATRDTVDNIYSSANNFNLNATDLNLSNLTGGINVPTGSSAQRPSPVAGVLRFNSDLGKYEVSEDGSSWTALQTSGGIFNLTKDVFTGDGSTTAFTMSKTPYSDKNIIVYIDGVMQEPTQSYTISGTTLSITEAVHTNGRVVVMHGFDA